MRAKRFFRAVSSMLLITFSTSCLQPFAASATQLPTATASKMVLAPSADERYSRLLDQVRDSVRRGKAKRQQGKDAKEEINAIKARKSDLEGLEPQLDAGFMEVERALRSLPAVLLERHVAAVAELKARQSEFKRLVKDLEDADAVRLGASDLAVEALDTFFRKLPHARRHSPVDPNNLPFRMPSSKIRPPATDVKALRAAIGETALQLAGPIPADMHLVQWQPKAAAGPTPSDLVETEDVQITQAVRDKAVELGKNPVNLFSWVRNNIEYLPTYGSIQGSDMTLQTKRGNAFDTASLLIALLRASGIHARYAYGTIEVPIDRAMNWVGGVTKPEVALSLMGQGGIPSTAVLEGGRISKIRLEHIWVEAWVDYNPSRGARHVEGDTWVPMDPSFKQFTFTPGQDLRQLVPFDSQSYANDAAIGVTANEAEGWVQGVEPLAAVAAMERYGDEIRDLNSALFLKPRSYFEGKKQIVERTVTLLAGSLETRVLGSIGMSALPESMRLTAELRLYESEFDRQSDSAALTYKLPLPRLATKRLSITHVPASEADAAAIQQAKESGATTLPAYLIRMRPQIQVDGETVATHVGLRMGQTSYWSVSILGQSQVGQAQPYRVTVGDEAVIGLNLSEIDEDLVRARKSKFPDDTAAENLMIVAMNFWMAHDTFDRLLGTLIGVHRGRLVSHGLFMSPLTVNFLFGVPVRAGYAGRTMDVGHVVPAVAGESRLLEAEFRRMAGRMGSAYEGLTFDLVFGRAIGTGISAVRLIADAMQQGARLYKVTSANRMQALSAISTTDEVKDDIANAIGAGKFVYVTDKEMVRQSYRGIGYIVEDPETGAAAYLIDGGRNGGADDPCPSGTATAPVTDTAKMSIFEGVVWSLAIAVTAVVVVRALPVVLLGGAMIFAATANAGVPAFVSKLPAHYQQIWDQVYAPRYGIFRSNAPQTNPAETCDGATLKSVRDQKNAACNRKRSCATAKDCAEVSTFMQRNVECGEARLNVMFTCFGGGDATHWRVLEEDVLRPIDRCACAVAGPGCR